MAEQFDCAVPDVLAEDLDVVFCGINPGRFSDAAAAHFANPRNDFWRLLNSAGFTPTIIAPSDQFDLLPFGIGATNAAARTTPGSGDLRRPDFEGSAYRLGRLAAELRPRVIAFVGKEAYRGAFGERPAHGLQKRRLGETELWVLPSTSPANAAVPWDERLDSFVALRDHLHPLRHTARAVVLSPESDILLVRFELPWVDRPVWALPGGQIEPGENEIDCVRRELQEETGLDGVDIGPLLWRRRHRYRAKTGLWAGQAEAVYLVHAGRVPPAPQLTVEELASEYVTDVRWWGIEQLETLKPDLAPPRLVELVRQILAEGPPAEPLNLSG